MGKREDKTKLVVQDLMGQIDFLVENNRHAEFVNGKLREQVEQQGDTIDALMEQLERAGIPSPFVDEEEWPEDPNVTSVPEGATPPSSGQEEPVPREAEKKPEVDLSVSAFM